MRDTKFRVGDIWLDVILKGKMVEINGKGQVREKGDRCYICDRLIGEHGTWTTDGLVLCGSCLE